MVILEQKYQMQIDIPLCPILKPTYQEFKHFGSYVEKVEKQYRGQYGMVKIIPPREWISRSKDYEARLQNIKFIKPEYQTICGNRINYFYKCKNEKCDRMTLRQFKKIAASKQKQIVGLRKDTLIEQEFWNGVSSLNRQLYCANVEISLMDDTSKQWEFQKLNSFFSKVVSQKIHGLNTSFLFIGAWKTFFNWHIQDLDLSAINLLHEGAPKMWYAIHPQDRKKFEGIMGSLFPDESMKCTNFLRHKQVFTDPYKFKKNHPSIRISKMFQCEGEISLAFAEAYHSGFNMGYNIAEAVNYGTSDWLQRYSKFKGCSCPLKIGVQLDHSEMIQNIKKSRLYNKIQKVPAFQKIVQKAKIDNLPEELFEQADSMEIQIEIEKAKTKPINKGKKLIYVSKYNRYFPAEKTLYLGCDECRAWRKVNTQIHDKMKNNKVECKDIGYSCRQSVTKRKEKPTPKTKKINKKSISVSECKDMKIHKKNNSKDTIMVTRSKRR